jgi:SAM-dependent methyltransferase
VSVAPPLEDTACVLCGEATAHAVWTTRDRAFGIPGTYTVVRCDGCGHLYQRPRVRADRLADCYPDGYPRHQEPSPRSPFRGPAARQRAARWALAWALGYPPPPDPPSVLDRWRAWRLGPRIVWDCPPCVGARRLLDVGCGSGGFLGVARDLGWQCAGIEMDPAAAAKARRYTPSIFIGDILEAPFTPGTFDLVTAFHVLEHVPEPRRVLERMLDWTADEGRVIVEVPNAGGLGASLFRAAWSGLELPRHLSHFTPATLGRLVEQSGGRLVRWRHRAKPRQYLWSLGHWLDDRGYPRFARAITGPLRGPLKLGLELALPLVARAGRGEAVRIEIAPVRRRLESPSK